MPFPKKQKILFQCEQCGEVLKTYPYKKGKARFCSDKCKYLYIKLKMLRKHAAKRIAKVPAKCQNIFCGKIFWVIPSLAGKRKHCCNACRLYTLTSEYKEEMEYRQEQQRIKDNISRMILLNK